MIGEDAIKILLGDGCDTGLHFRDCPCNHHPVLLMDWKGDSHALKVFGPSYVAGGAVAAAKDWLLEMRGRLSSATTPVYTGWFYIPSIHDAYGLSEWQPDYRPGRLDNPLVVAWIAAEDLSSAGDLCPEVLPGQNALDGSDLPL